MSDISEIEADRAAIERVIARGLLPTNPAQALAGRAALEAATAKINETLPASHNAPVAQADATKLVGHYGSASAASIMAL